MNCDFVAHGDDIPIAADGHCAYHTVMDKLKIFKRTEGISTTHLIQRLLDAAKSSEESYSLKSDVHKIKRSESFASSSRISAFSNDKTPKEDDTVIYIDGIFDLFHIGHISALKKAKEFGTFLYVGLYDDEDVRSRKGPCFPVMNLQERVLNVLSCKYVDDVLIGAPWKISKQMIKSLNIKMVITTPNTMFAPNEMDRYALPKEMGIFKEVETECKFTTDDLMKSIVEHHGVLESQNKNKVQRAKQYANNNKYIQELTK